MEPSPSPINNDLFNLAREAFDRGMDRLHDVLISKKYIGTYYSWPKFEYFSNGLPNFSESSFFDSSPTDYKRAFGTNEDWQIRTDAIPAFKALLQYARTDKQLKDHFSWGTQPIPDSFFEFSITYFIEKLIDRHMHLFPDKPPDLETFKQIYRPLEAYLYQETLYVDVVVPILFLKFDFDKLALGPNTLIERMNDDFQLVRFSKKAYSPSVHSSVLGAATHALVLKGWSIENSSDLTLSRNFSRLDYYQKPLEFVDSFFAAIRVKAALHTGYAQVLLKPLNWASTYAAHLPPLEGTSLRRYPGWFEDYYWTQDVPVVPSKQLLDCSDLFHKLTGIENNRLRIAVKRFNGCHLREADEDSILDITIAMEALLSDDDRQEMTHKLALRIAALSTLVSENAPNPLDVFKAIKHIYRYRSKIVHGSTKTQKSREISIGSTQTIPTVTIALEYLRMLISILVLHQQFLKPSIIDETLLLRPQNSLAGIPIEDSGKNHTATANNG
ncbi:MAG: hypothetical protein WEF53_01680 [Bacteroidota bacterium]